MECGDCWKELKEGAEYQWVLQNLKKLGTGIHGWKLGFVIQEMTFDCQNNPFMKHEVRNRKEYKRQEKESWALTEKQGNKDANESKKGEMKEMLCEESHVKVAIPAGTE